MRKGPNWELRRQRYGPSGVKNPDLYKERCSKAHKGHPPYAGFKDHNLGAVCHKCEGEGKHGKTHGSIESRTKNLQRWREKYGSPTKGCNYGGICPKHGVDHGPPGMQGKHHSEESKLKSSESNKIAHNTPEMLAKKSEDAKKQWQNPAVRARARESFQDHWKAVLEEAERLRLDGYEVLPMDKVLRPDMIAKKDGKLFAVEVDFDGNTRKGKYDGVTFFDDVIWRYRHREPLYKANCQTCGKEFGYDIKSANQKFCSEKCYYASMEGKEEAPWLVESRVKRGRAAHRLA